MKLLRYLMTAAVLIAAGRITAQVKISGSLQSSLYTFETPAAVQQGSFYQSLRLRVAPQNYSRLYLSSYLRVAKLGNRTWAEKVYNLYADWKSSNQRFQLRAGRQFLYQGVINGTMDGLLLSANPARNLTVKFFAGLEAPLSREFKAADTDSNVLGGYLSYRFSGAAKIDFSYFQKKRPEGIVWQIGGAALSGRFRENFYYQAQIDHNLKTEQLQGMRYRLNYLRGPWSLSGEFNFQRPRIYEDSYFRVFQLQAYNQIRGEVSYQLSKVRFGVQYIFTDYEFDQGNQAVLTIANRWGVVGLVLQEGYAGNNAGVYGQVRYAILPELTVNLYSSYYNFERFATRIDEDATAFSGGFEFRPVDFLSLSAEVQESINSFYSDDFRGLFRINYFFRQ